MNGMNAAALLLWTALIVFAVITGCTDTAETETGPVTSSPTVLPAGAGGDVIDANNMFAFDMYRQIAGETTEDTNIFFSPFSISSALALTYEGARGETAEQIRSVFHFPEDINALREGYLNANGDINSGDPEYELEIANALWAEKTYPFLEDYIDTAERYYSAKTTNLDFINEPERSRLIINDWVEEKTRGRIEDLIPEGMIVPLTRLVITNAIYFKGTWALQFDESMTSAAEFTTASGGVAKVDMMQRTDSDAVYGYNETDEYQALKMPYEHETGKELSMLVILPKENNMQAVEGILNPDDIKKIENSMESRRIKLFFPRFRLETVYSLAGSLKSLGISDAFSNKTADFSGMDGTSEIFISGVVHKAFVEVNEEGTEAAAATAVAGTGSSPPGAIPVFRADHPFIFLIQDDETGNILFIGRISNPQ